MNGENERKPDRIGAVFASLGKSICYLALFFGMQIVVMMPVMVNSIMEGLTGRPMEEDALVDAIMGADTMLLSLIANLLTLAFVLLFYLIRRKKLSEALWLRRVPASTLWTGAALAPALYLVVTVVLAALPEAWLDSYSEASADITGGTAIGAVAVALMAPIVEEFIFRGLIMTRLSRAMPGWLAVVLSAAIFGVCHGHPVWFGYAFVLGAVFGFMDLKAGSIWPSILGHMAFNAIGQIFSIIPETEEGTEIVAAVGVLLLAAIILPLLDRKGVAALFRRTPPAPPAQQRSWPLRSYDYDPWDE